MQRAAEMLANCTHCHTPLDPDAHTTYTRVLAWERKSATPSRRSGSDLVLRERLEEYACSTCVAQMRRGVAPVQGVLV